MEEAAVGEEAAATRLAVGRRRPDERLQRLVAAIVDAGMGADVEIARAVVLEGRQRGVLAEDVGDALPGEGLAVPRRRATSAMIHQSCRASPGGGRNGRWREMPRSELVTVPSFSAQASAGRRMRQASTVSLARTASETIEARSPSAPRAPHRRWAGWRPVGRHDPYRLDLAARRPPRTDRPPSGRAASPCARRARSGRRDRHRPARNPCGRPACWTARRPRGRPWRWAGR